MQYHFTHYNGYRFGVELEDEAVFPCINGKRATWDKVAACAGSLVHYMAQDLIDFGQRKLREIEDEQDESVPAEPESRPDTDQDDPRIQHPGVEGRAELVAVVPVAAEVPPTPRQPGHGGGTECEYRRVCPPPPPEWLSR
ncbi:hypothetical protein PPphikF77_gp14 [Pseudomonas phage phikF77]|uniref:Uncharacterized protein n=1 Tax=Pseudomonas phage phikF77 TaxID=627480 RepID=C0MQD7_9CAUD|nr:hypothetical protein PPphikF77_gp14 [Pseudomonas phage phikF77]CAX63128.1 hypothetical protein [Pseudomonas phage phikF77]